MATRCSCRSVQQEKKDLKEQLQGVQQENKDLNEQLQGKMKEIQDMKEELDYQKRCYSAHIQCVQKELQQYKQVWYPNVVREKDALEAQLFSFDCQQCKVLRKEVDAYKTSYPKCVAEITDLKAQLQESSFAHRLVQKVFSCDKCAKLQQKVDVLEDDNTKKDEEIQRLCIKMNADFGHHQGNSMEVEEMKRLWDHLFIYTVEKGVAKDDPQKNVFRRVYCDMFMTIGDFVKSQIISRIADCFTALFLPGRLDTSNINLKAVERAFSILVTIPKVQEKVKLSSKVRRDFRELQQHYNLKNVDNFVECALSLCVSMSTRVPPYIVSNDEKQFVEEIHDPKFIKGFPYPQEQQPVSYLRPTVYYNYQGKVFMKGLVIGSTSTATL